MDQLSKSGIGFEQDFASGQFSIRRSTEKDICVIYDWLNEEAANGVHGNFLCNWDVIMSHHKEGRLLVFVDSASRIPVAYLGGGLIEPGILQVRFDMRRKGIGRKLVAHCIAAARKKNECILAIECQPPTSISFWKAMGFKLIDDPLGKNYAYRLVEKSLPLPEDCNKVDAEIRFYPAARAWDKNVRPFKTITPETGVTSNGVVHLCERVSCYDGSGSSFGELFVEIDVAGQQRYAGKATYDEAKAIGIHRCRNGYYIDRIQPAS